MMGKKAPEIIETSEALYLKEEKLALILKN